MLAAQLQTDNPTNRSIATATELGNSSSDISPMLTLDVNFHAWFIQADDNYVHTTVYALDPNLPQSDICCHDIGANYHVFHNCNVFETYKQTKPLIVCRFSHNLLTTVIEHGIVQLESHHGKKVHNIVLQNVLHVPVACINLISSIQLDKARVITIFGNGSLVLAANGKTIVEGKIINDMY
jgi:Pol polyprotein